MSSKVIPKDPLSDLEITKSFVIPHLIPEISNQEMIQEQYISNLPGDGIYYPSNIRSILHIVPYYPCNLVSLIECEIRGTHWWEEENNFNNNNNEENFNNNNNDDDEIPELIPDQDFLRNLRMEEVD